MLGGKYVLTLTRSPAATTCPHEGWKRSPPSICRSEWLSQRCHFGSQFICYFLSGTQIYCLNGTDPEGQEVRYGLSFDPGSKEFFRVEPISGNITLVEQLDREVNCLWSWWNNNFLFFNGFYFLNFTFIFLKSLFQKQDSIDVLVSITDGKSKVFTSRSRCGLIS